jgi:hypothetical protein
MKARISIVLGVLAIASPAAADIDGKYKFDSSDDTGGSQFMGKPGHATVKKLGKAYTITHGFMGGPGLGLKGGTKSVFFCVPVQGGGCGIAVYKIEKNGGLTGVWSADLKKGATGTEKWAEADGAAGQAEADEERSLAGSYTIVGTNPGQKGQYQGTVTVVASDSGPGYKVTWEVGGQTYTGIGADSNGYFGVAYGGGTYWLAAYGIYKKTLGGALLTSGWEALSDPDDPESDMSRYYDDMQTKK